MNLGIALSSIGMQQIGIGVSAFLITITLAYLYIFGRGDRTGRALMYVFITLFAWSWVAYLYGLTSDPGIGRELRVVSAVALLFLFPSAINFAFVYLEEARPLTKLEQQIRIWSWGAAMFLLGIVSFDFFGGRLIVGDLSSSPQNALSPHAGPLLPVYIAFNVYAIIVTAYTLSKRVRAATSKIDRKQALILFVGLTVGSTLACLRWAPWYGYSVAPAVGGLAVLLLVSSAFYNFKTYQSFDTRLAGAELLVFALWTFSFFRILVDPTPAITVLDIIFFVIVLFLGATLIRSIRKSDDLAESLAHLNANLEQEVDKRTDALVSEKTEFITIAAHSLRTPITAIRWSFESLLNSANQLDEDTRKVITTGHDATEHMMMVINDLLNFVRASGGAITFMFAREPLGPCIEESVSAIRPNAQQRHIGILLEPTNDLPVIPYDKRMLQIALVNILDNAIKYSPDGERVTVALSCTGSSVHIRIADNGIGISDEDRKMLFSRFFRGARAMHMSTVGSGLGLVIVKKIVEGHGGELSLESEAEKGTTVTITLPVGMAPATQEEGPSHV